jgi:hypothetical protein
LWNNHESYILKFESVEVNLAKQKEERARSELAKIQELERNMEEKRKEEVKRREEEENRIRQQQEEIFKRQREDMQNEQRRKEDRLQVTDITNQVFIM